MDVTVADLIEAFEDWAPSRLAEDWDNVGLQVGSLRKNAQRIALALDLTPSTLEQALGHRVDTIITHHPLLFRPLKRLDWEDWLGRVLKTLIQHEISLVSLHTNLDSAREGVTEILAQALHLRLKGTLRPSPGAKWYKLVTFVPKGYEEKLREVILESEAGVIGSYRGCTFATEGQGSFYPEEEAEPYAGEKGRLNLVAETRLEVVVPEFALSLLKKKLKAAHPYEEVPFDLYPLKGFDPRFGLGRWGVLPLELTVRELAQKLSSLLETEAVFIVGDENRLVQKVALCAGAGADLIPEARACGAEVFVTAEVKYHQAREAEALGFPLIVVGHFESERLIVPKMAEFLRNWAQKKACSLEIIVLEERTPFKLLRS